VTPWHEWKKWAKRISDQKGLIDFPYAEMQEYWRKKIVPASAVRLAIMNRINPPSKNDTEMENTK
jgi:hypothetical protein